MTSCPSKLALTEKQKYRRQLQKDIESFLSAGNHIKHIPPGLGADDFEDETDEDPGNT